MSSMNRYLWFSSCGVLVLCAAVQAQAVCPAGRLWEPYTEVCAEVRDVRGEFLSPLQISASVHSDAPVPGTMTAGTAYAPEQLIANDSGRLHTRMFVYPDGLERDGPLPSWLYTTATSRVDDGLEVVAMYTESQDTGSLGLFAWTCLPDFPCPDGATFPDWQWSRPLPQFTCNITQIVDQGGHANKQLYYANHSDRIDAGSPPLWKSAVYLWNYCDSAWDLAWEHVYRQDKNDCSVPGAACAWWGPAVEIFGSAVYPQIGELGYEDSLLYHDGSWSQLLPPEAQFRDPTNPSWGSLTPWQLFHLEPNRSYGIGNWFNVNDAPVIESQEVLNTGEGESLPIDTTLLTISDADIDPVYHVDFELTVYGGNNYTYDNGELTPDAGFTGTLVVPISVNDGAAESATFELLVSVGTDKVAPEVLGQVPLQTLEDQPIVISLDDLVVNFPGGDPASLAVIVHAGQFYSHTGTTVTPLANFFGVLSVPVTVSDGLLESDVFDLVISVVAVNDAPSIIGQHALQTLERTPIEIRVGDLLISDPDDELSELSVRVLDGIGYQRVGNTVTPDADIIGALDVKVVVSDGQLDSDTFDLSIQVIADSVPPEISLIGSAAISVRLGSLYTDAGASAIDNVDGDISDRIVVTNPVNTDRAGTYTISYSVEDLAGNAAVATRSVVVEVAAPVVRNSGGGAISILVLAILLAFAFLQPVVPAGNRVPV